MRIAVLLAAGAAAFAAHAAAAQSLPETIDAALAHSPALAAAKAREEAAEAGVDQARAERNPSASLQGQVGVGWIDPRGFFALPADDVTPRVAQVAIEMPLYTGGRVSAGIEQAQAGREAAALGVKSAALELRLQVVRAYSQALAASEQIASYRAMQAALTEVLRQSRLKFEAGDATSTDIAQADARLAEADAGAARAEGLLAQAQVTLDRLAGQPVATHDLLPPPPPTPADREEAIALAVTNNPQVAQARNGAAIARAALRAAEAERMPTLGAYAEGSSVRDQFFPGYKADSASVGLRAQWKFFTGGRTGAKITKAEAEARAAEADARLAEQAVEIGAVQGFEAVRTARAMLVAAEKREAATQEALRSTRLEVGAGAKPQLALLDAEREAIEARTARIAAAGNLLTSAYTLRSITGMD